MDAPHAAPASHCVLLDNDRVRVLEGRRGACGLQVAEGGRRIGLGQPQCAEPAAHPVRCGQLQQAAAQYLRDQVGSAGQREQDKAHRQVRGHTVSTLTEHALNPRAVGANFRATGTNSVVYVEIAADMEDK